MTFSELLKMFELAKIKIDVEKMMKARNKKNIWVFDFSRLDEYLLIGCKVDCRSKIIQGLK